MPITMLYAGALGILFVVLSYRVVAGRQKTRTNMGDGGNPTMLRLMRGHANFAEYVPLTLIVMALFEGGGAPAWSLHAIGGSLLLGRILHGYTFAFTDHFFVGRFAGTVLTWLALLGGSGGCLWLALRAL